MYYTCEQRFCEMSNLILPIFLISALRNATLRTKALRSCSESMITQCYRGRRDDVRPHGVIRNRTYNTTYSPCSFYCVRKKRLKWYLLYFNYLRHI